MPPRGAIHCSSTVRCGDDFPTALQPREPFDERRLQECQQKQQMHGHVDIGSGLV